MDNATETKPKKKKHQCVTPEFRVSFPQVFKPKAFENQEAKFSIQMLFAKSTDITELRKIVFECAAEKWGKDKTKWPRGLRFPFKNGDEKADLQGYAGHTVVGASSKMQPGVVSSAVDPATGKLEVLSEESGRFYAGCYARASVMAYTYDKAGNRGVSLSLQNVQKLGDGEAFSGRRQADDEFDPVERPDADSEDPDNYDLGDG